MKNFTQIENIKIDDSNISDGAFRTYMAIRSYKYGNHDVFPSIKSIAKKRGKSIKTITTHLNELRLKGWIKTKKRGYSMSNLYELVGVENFTPKWRFPSIQYRRKLQPNNTRDNNTEDKNMIPFGNLELLKPMREMLIRKKVILPLN